MKTILPDGRVFETMPFTSITYRPEELVYKYQFETKDRTVKSSLQHEWAVWDNKLRDVLLKRMEDINIAVDELLIQSWKE